MSKKSTPETKVEKQAVSKQPIELQEVDLDKAQGGSRAAPSGKAGDGFIFPVGQSGGTAR